MTRLHTQATGRPYYILERRTGSKYHKIGEREAIRLDQIEIGRDPQCRVHFEDSFTTVSRRHAAIVKEGERWKLIRISDINPTLVNGNIVSNQWYLRHNDEIELSAGGPRLRFIIPPPENTEHNNHEAHNIHIPKRLDAIARQLVTLFRRTNIAIACALITLIAVIAAISILTGIDRTQTRFINETRTETANIKQSIETVNIGLDEVRNGLEMIKGRQDQLEQLVSNHDNELTKQIQAGAGIMNSRISASESRLAEDIAGIKRQIFSKQQRPAVRPPAAIPHATATAARRSRDNNNDNPPSKTIPEAAFANCTPYIYYIRLDKIETVSDKNDFRLFKTDKISWAGTGSLLSDGRFVTARSVIEPWKFIERTELAALNAIAEKGGRITAYFTAISPAGHSFAFTGATFAIDRSADSFNPARKQTFAPPAANKNIAVMQTQQRGGLQFTLNPPPPGATLYARGYPSQPGLDPSAAITSGSGETTAAAQPNELIPATTDSFLQLGSGSPVFVAGQSGQPQATGILAVSPSDGQRLVIPIPAP